MLEKRDINDSGDDTWRVLLLGGVVGGGKTRETLKQLVELHQQRKLDGEVHKPFVVFVPRHELGEQIAKERPELNGLNVRVIYGRRAKDPRHAKADRADANWCHKVEQVKMAEDLSMPIEQTCCRRKELVQEIKCQSYHTCGFQEQFRNVKDVDVFVMPHAYLPHEHRKIPRPYLVFVDEDPTDALVFELPKRKRGKEDGDDEYDNGEREFRMPLDTLLEKGESGDNFADTCLNFFIKQNLHALLLHQIKAEPIPDKQQADEERIYRVLMGRSLRRGTNGVTVCAGAMERIRHNSAARHQSRDEREAVRTLPQKARSAI